MPLLSSSPNAIGFAGGTKGIPRLAKRGIPLVPPAKPMALGEEESKGIALPRDFKSLPLGKHR